MGATGEGGADGTMEDTEMVDMMERREREDNIRKRYGESTDNTSTANDKVNDSDKKSSVSSDGNNNGSSEQQPKVKETKPIETVHKKSDIIDVSPTLRSSFFLLRNVKIFSDSPVPSPAKEQGPGMGLPVVAVGIEKVDKTHFDNWDDAEGYYCM